MHAAMAHVRSPYESMPRKNNKLREDQHRDCRHDHVGYQQDYRNYAMQSVECGVIVRSSIRLASTLRIALPYPRGSW